MLIGYARQCITITNFVKYNFYFCKIHYIFVVNIFNYVYSFAS